MANKSNLLMTILMIASLEPFGTLPILKNQKECPSLESIVLVDTPAATVESLESTAILNRPKSSLFIY